MLFLERGLRYKNYFLERMQNLSNFQLMSLAKKGSLGSGRVDSLSQKKLDNLKLFKQLVEGETR